MSIKVLQGVALTDENALRPYWQQEPVVLKAALDVTALVPDPAGLVALITETDLPSRLITGAEGGRFTLKHGPFESFKAPKGPWTVLIQALEHLFPEYDALRRAITWLPSWRFEDCMLSWASEGGSVGRHVDQFSVFLVQLHGRRHWELGPRASSETPILANQPLALVAATTPELAVTAEPGDVIYLPPGVVHHGVSLDPDCMTLSIGFRAPDIGQLLEAALEHCGSDASWMRYHDPEPGHRRGPAEITEADLGRVQELFTAFCADRRRLAHILASRVTAPYLDLMPEMEIEPEDAHDWIDDDLNFTLDPGVRIAYFEDRVFINGEHIGDQAPAAILELADTRAIHSQAIRQLDPEWHGCVVDLIVTGGLQPPED